MAIERTLIFHREFAPIEGAYLHITEFAYNSLGNHLAMKIAAWKSKESRDIHKTAKADSLRLSLRLQELQVLVNEAPSINPSADELTAFHARRDEYRKELRSAQSDLDEAHQRLNSVQALYVLEKTVPADEVPSCLTDDWPDRAKVYAWLMKQEGFEGEKA